MKRYVITRGARTTANGVVLTGSELCDIDGIPVAREGDLIDCPACNGTGRIRCVGPRIPSDIEGRQKALEGDLCICGCSPPPKLLAIQSLSFQDVEGEPDRGAAAVPGSGGGQADMASTAMASASASGEPDSGNEFAPPSGSGYAERFQLTDERTGEALSGVAYCIEVDGERITGRSSAEGFTCWVYSDKPSGISIHWGRDAERHVRQQD
ncbi:MAG: PAAR domain-containing protein [Azoarcus sp.]|jgi:uncharacterized Zn-binding protein involved in type VI secretion|nr:PAAR domain-containing protein [Azoarcus sp.]